MVFEHHKKSLRRLFNFEGFFRVYRKLKKKKTKERKKKVQFLTGFAYTKSRIKWLLDLGAVSE